MDKHVAPFKHKHEPYSTNMKLGKVNTKVNTLSSPKGLFCVEPQDQQRQPKALSLTLANLPPLIDPVTFEKEIFTKETQLGSDASFNISLLLPGNPR